MSKAKIRFNLMDALILVLVLAVIALLLYVFVFSETSSVQSVNAERYTLTYVVEVSNISEEFSDMIAAGDTVIDSSKKMHIGTVTAVEVQPHLHMGTNLHEGTLVLNPVDDYVNLYVTIQAEATLENISYTVNGYEIYVGKSINLAFSDFVCNGYCISLDAVQ